MTYNFEVLREKKFGFMIVESLEFIVLLIMECSQFKKYIESNLLYKRYLQS